MPGVASSWRRLLRLVRPNIRADVDDELGFHLEMRVRDLMARGLSEAAAREEAARQFGDLRLVRDACVTIDERRQRRTAFTEVFMHVRQDVTFALRTLRRSPGFAAMAIICLALGIGITTTVFGAVNATLLRPLPYPDADRLVIVYAQRPVANARGINISLADYLSWRDENRSFSQLGIWTWSSHALSGGGREAEAERVEGAMVSWNTFTALGIRPLLGRTFVEDENRPGNDRVVVLGYGLWQRRYGGDSGIVGKTIQIDGGVSTVVGVMPPRFAFPDGEQLWVPFAERDDGRGNRGYGGAVGRLRPGVTFEQAQADLAIVSRRLEQAFPQDNHDWAAEPVLMRDDLVGSLRRPLFVFLGAVGFVLLIACANVANLMLVRGAARQREMAIRVAVGAGRRQLVRQLLTESLVLALVGGAIGAALSVAGVRLLRVAFADRLPAFAILAVDASVLGFAVAVSALTGVVFGLIPALRATSVDPTRSLREGGRGSSAGMARSRLRNGLVIGEVALSLVLLIGAALLGRSYRALSSTDLGFDQRGVLSMRVSMAGVRYPRPEQRRVFWEQLFERIRALPGVETVGSANGIPFSGWNVQAELSVEGHPAARLGEEFVAHYQQVSPDYFEAIGVPLVRGRLLMATDRDTSTRVGVINETFARLQFPGEDPLGKRVRFGRLDPWVTIVGVIGDFRHFQLPEAVMAAMYFPLFRDPSGTQTVVIRTSLADPMSLATPVRGVLRSLDAEVPAFRVQTFDQAVSRSLWRQRMQGQALGVFSILAVLLATVGIYGVISYTVAQRGRELGVRMALGATARDVVRLVVAQGARLALAGVALGIVGALLLSRVLSTLLYGVTATDPLTFIVVPLGLAVVAAVASWVPALRATRVDPVIAIRSD